MSHVSLGTFLGPNDNIDVLEVRERLQAEEGQDYKGYIRSPLWNKSEINLANQPGGPEVPYVNDANSKKAWQKIQAYRKILGPTFTPLLNRIYADPHATMQIRVTDKPRPLHQDPGQNLQEFSGKTLAKLNICLADNMESSVLHFQNTSSESAPTLVDVERPHGELILLNQELTNVARSTNRLQKHVYHAVRNQHLCATIIICLKAHRTAASLSARLIALFNDYPGIKVDL